MPDILHKPKGMTFDLSYETLVHAPFSIVWFDLHGKLLDYNDYFYRLASPHLTIDNPLGVSDLFGSIDATRWSKLIARLDEEQQVVTHESLKLAEPHSVELTLLKISDRKDSHFVMFLRDLDELQQRQGIQLLQHEVLEAVALGRPLTVLMELICTRVEAMAPEVVCTVLMVDAEGRVHPCAAPSMPKQFSEAIDNAPIGPKAGSCGTAAWRGEPVEVTDIANDPLWDDYKALALPLGLAACWSTPIKTRDGRVVGTFALYYREVRSASEFHRQMVNACVYLCSLAIEHEESEQQIHQLAFYDPLTGLANRNLLRDRAQQALLQVVKMRNPLTVMFLDLDRFKTINDSMGHSVGDRMLKRIASRLQQCLKPNDTIARLGGDEFIFLLTDTGAAQARRLADKFLRLVTEPVAIDQHEFSATASIGISVAPDDALDFEALLKNADVAMYQAKSDGRNTYRFFQPQMNQVATERLAMETALRRALAENELMIYYQPQINIREKRVHGMEALVRWRHPQWGVVSPVTFIPIAEECGLISAIDHWVLAQSCLQFTQWREQGINIDRIAVNLSAVDILHSDIPELIRKLLKQHKLPANALTLEITEGIMLHSSEEVTATLNELHEIGVNLAVDDFGIGYSSLSYIRRFPVTELKLDKSFINDIADNQNDRALANAIVQMGRILNLEVVAEGVETEQQFALLKDWDCPIVQGYYLARPMSQENATQWLTQPIRNGWE